MASVCMFMWGYRSLSEKCFSLLFRVRFLSTRCFSSEHSELPHAKHRKTMKKYRVLNSSLSHSSYFQTLLRNWVL